MPSEALGERIDPDADARGTGIGKTEGAGADIDHDLSAKEFFVLDRRLTQDADHLGSGLLSASPEVRRRDLLVA